MQEIISPLPPRLMYKKLRPRLQTEATVTTYPISWNNFPLQIRFHPTDPIMGKGKAKVKYIYSRQLGCRHPENTLNRYPSPENADLVSLALYVSFFSLPSSLPFSCSSSVSFSPHHECVCVCLQMTISCMTCIWQWLSIIALNKLWGHIIWTTITQIPKFLCPFRNWQTGEGKKEERKREQGEGRKEKEREGGRRCWGKREREKRVERRGRVKSRKMYKVPMDKDNGRKNWMWEMGAL